MNKSYVTNRIAAAFALCLGFGSLCLHQAAAQTAEQAQKPPADREHPAQACIPASAPVPPMPPGLFPSATPKPTENPTRTVHQAVAHASPVAREPEQMKVVRLYRGQGFFDAGLAEKLRPELAKAFGITPASGAKPGDASPDLLRSVFGQKEGPEKNTNQKSVTDTGQP